jgi:hypothetical protein
VVRVRGVPHAEEQAGEHDGDEREHGTCRDPNVEDPPASTGPGGHSIGAI